MLIVQKTPGAAEALSNLKDELNKQFKMTDLDFAQHYLDIEIICFADKITLTQTDFINEILKQFDMKNSALKSMSIVSDIQLDSDFVSNYLTDVNKQHYQ